MSGEGPAPIIFAVIRNPNLTSNDKTAPKQGSDGEE
jgi:hypothetical protein